MLKNSVRFFAMFAAISAAEATTVKIVNHDYTGVSSAFPKNTPYYGNVRLTVSSSNL